MTSYYNIKGEEITRAAFFALRAAQMRKQIGRDAATRYAIKNGSSQRLIRIAYQLQAAMDADLRSLRGLDFTDSEPLDTANAPLLHD